MDLSEARTARSGWRRNAPRLLLAAALLAAIASTLWASDLIDPAALDRRLRDLGLWAPLAFMLLFAAATVLLVPGALFGLLGGALFGPLWGALWNLLGATLGATLAFLAARYVTDDWVRRRAGDRLGRIVAGVEAEGWRFVAMMRLVPLVPFNLANYALGSTRIPLRQYVVTSLVCMIPGTLAYAWLGHAGRAAAAGDVAAIRYGLLALALIALVAFLPRLLRRWQSDAGRWIEVDELAASLRDGGSVHVVDVRSAHEFDGPLGHIPGARLVPIDTLAERTAELREIPTGTLVVVCKTDKRSTRAAATLRAAGLAHVRVLRGGMERWNARRPPVEPADSGDSRTGKQGARDEGSVHPE